MNILITGKNGFIARNLIKRLENKHNVISVTHADKDEFLNECCRKCDVVYHLAAVQRSSKDEDFISGNIHYTKKITKMLEDNDNCVPIIFTTSIQIDRDKNTIFSRTKMEAEKILREYGEKHRKNIVIFKLNNIFGEFGKPNFNNVIATFCYNIAKAKPIQVDNPGVLLPFTYIGDLLDDFENILEKIDLCSFSHNEYVKPNVIEYRTLGEIVKILGDAINKTETKDGFSQKLYRTLYSYY